MIRDSLRRRVSALEHDRQEREKFTGAATEQALNYPTADKRWVAAPAIRTPVSCKCGGEFTVSLGVIPA